MRKSLALVAALAVLTAGCAADTKRATNVTSSSATLNAEVRCDPGSQGTAWWELREAGAATWRLTGANSPFSCPDTDLGTVRISKHVDGLRPGVRYDYRLAANPAPTGGRVFYSEQASFSTQRFSPGLVASADHALSAAAAGELGAEVVRVEFDIGTPVASLRGSVGAIADQGARPLLLAGFHGRMPTQAEAQNLATWAAEFGPGGSFWAGRPDGRLAVQQIEFGNETSYAHQYGDTWSDQSYMRRAELYAVRFAQAHAAIAFTGRDVGLLAQADDGGTGSSNWVDHMFDAIPNLNELVDGWAVHPYGPRDRWEPKLDRLVAQTAANGARGTIPIDITEYGISSANGTPLTDNYGWPVNLTFDQAASALDSTIAAMLADPAIGPRLRLFMIYAAHNLRPPGTTREREHNFGVLQHNLAFKGAYSTEVREQLER
ncbi:MAG: hypothetical protein H0T69_00200 [Thermoleophilaceae bacterium]|nr:hypothetical protein [Thermoleophilaceae bacterium]